MREQIIEASIKSLQQEGLRFSVDVLAEKLKISKKTIYKYFPTKEALAYAIYENYYAALKDEIQHIILAHDSAMIKELLLCYFNSSKMVRTEIFNKYCLNNTIGYFATENHLHIWNLIQPYVYPHPQDAQEAAIYKLIIDGTFHQAAATNINPINIIEMLRKII